MKANVAIKTLKICKPCNMLKAPKCLEKKNPSMIL